MPRPVPAGQMPGVGRPRARPLAPAAAVSTPTRRRVLEALAEVSDPEIPCVSVVELGVVRDVAVRSGRVRIEFTPTYLGCPGLTAMRDRIAARVRALGGVPDVVVVLDDRWTPDRVTPAGREKLRAAGFALPPLRDASDAELDELRRLVVRCPRCGSASTRPVPGPGPAPCRTYRHCARCDRRFEELR